LALGSEEEDATFESQVNVPARREGLAQGIQVDGVRLIEAIVGNLEYSMVEGYTNVVVEFSREEGHKPDLSAVEVQGTVFVGFIGHVADRRNDSDSPQLNIATSRRQI